MRNALLHQLPQVGCILLQGWQGTGEGGRARSGGVSSGGFCVRWVRGAVCWLGFCMPTSHRTQAHELCNLCEIPLLHTACTQRATANRTPHRQKVHNPRQLVAGLQATAVQLMTKPEPWGHRRASRWGKVFPNSQQADNQHPGECTCLQRRLQLALCAHGSTRWRVTPGSPPRAKPTRAQAACRTLTSSAAVMTKAWSLKRSLGSCPASVASSAARTSRVVMSFFSRPPCKGKGGGGVLTLKPLASDTENQRMWDSSAPHCAREHASTQSDAAAAGAQRQR